MDDRQLIKEYGSLNAVEQYKLRWIEVCEKLKPIFLTEKEKHEKRKDGYLVVNRASSHSMNYLWRTLKQ